MATETGYDLDRFERLEIDPTAFGHQDHMRAAYAMLSRYDFLEACARYSATIKSMAESVGASAKFNATITIAFMSLIAERRSSANETNWDAFIASNSDLLEPGVLAPWYSTERLGSDLARTQFLLPDRSAATDKRPSH
ncbi:MAG: hypothetical protein AAGF59_04945 [Pseudomonadota bacterium]